MAYKELPEKMGKGGGRREMEGKKEGNSVQRKEEENK